MIDALASDHVVIDRFVAGPRCSPRKFTRHLIVGNSIGQADLAPAWLFNSYQQYRQKVTAPGFPCFYGQKAEVSGNLFYSFARSNDLTEIPTSLRTFVQLDESKVSDDANFILFMEPETTAKSHDFYRDQLWRILNFLFEKDNTPWPKRFARSPADSDWEFTFAGCQFFVVGASPTYKNRKSRNLGPGLILLFQPRSAFAVLDGKNHGEASIQKIRNRLAAFDELPAHPDLGAFADPSYREWKQYFLPDDNLTSTKSCPFNTGKNES